MGLHFIADVFNKITGASTKNWVGLEEFRTVVNTTNERLNKVATNFENIDDTNKKNHQLQTLLAELDMTVSLYLYYTQISHLLK